MRPAAVVDGRSRAKRVTSTRCLLAAMRAPLFDGRSPNNLLLFALFEPPQ
jgi:hypothetical protein